MLGRQPVEEHGVGNLTGHAAHLGTERRDDEARRKLGPERGDPFAHAREGAAREDFGIGESAGEGKNSVIVGGASLKAVDFLGIINAL